MEGYKTVTEALQKAHEKCGSWTALSTGDHMSFDDMVDLSLTEDMLFGLEPDEWFLALDDGAICLFSAALKRITVLFRPAAQAEQKTAVSKFCTKCGSPLRPGAKFCLKCGAALESSVRFCTGCGKPLREGASFCPSCGKKVVDR